MLRRAGTNQAANIRIVMTNSDSLSTLARIIAQGRGVLSSGKRETGIKAALESLFEDRYHARHKPKDGFRDAYGLANDDGVAWAGVIWGVSCAAA